MSYVEVPEVALKAQKGFILLFEPPELTQALIWHDLSHLKHLEFKILAQESNKVCMFDKTTNVSAPSE